MPEAVSEITSGTQASRTSENGRVTDSQIRAYKVLLSAPTEVIDIQRTCGVFIGNRHPYNTNLLCRSFDAKYDGDSRMVLICTFQYGTTPASDGNDRNEMPPSVRPANYTTSTTLVEVPAREWYEINSSGNTGARVPATNPVGDMYDGVSYMMGMMTINIEQYEPYDPARHVELAGCVNADTLYIGSLNCGPRTVMFRGVSFKPTVEAWGDNVFRGWMATYEFLYRQDTWDMRIPQTGFNVKAFAPPGGGGVDVYGQPLKHVNGKIVPALMLPEQINPNDKVRAMVKVFEYENGGASQLPSAQPVALTDEGYPRDPALPPIINRFCPYQPIQMASRLNLRLF